jgi:SAM-dependent methyltransferase
MSVVSVPRVSPTQGFWMRAGTLLTSGLLLLSALNMTAPGYASPGAPPAGDAQYTPQLGQPGKDVMWLPTRDDLVEKMLAMAEVGPNDVVYDLGAGDGKIAIAAALRHRARAVGIEYNQEMAALAERNTTRAGVSDRVRIIHGDIFKEDFSSATVLTLYLLEELNFRLRPSILAMKPGTRVVSNTFGMQDWEPDETAVVNSNTAYLWIVPAQVSGRWEIEAAPLSGDTRERYMLQLDQRFQRIGGTLQSGGTSQALLGAELRGSELRFRFRDISGTLRSARLRVNGTTLQGVVLANAGQIDIPVPVRGLAGRRVSD